MVGERTDSRPMLDMSQAAPSNPTAPEIADRIADVARRPDGGRYCPQQGLPHLREAFAFDLNAAYDAAITPDNIMISAGCNQAFCLIASALAAPGDEVILAKPFYLNHDMWLRLDGISPIHMPNDEQGLPDIRVCRSLLTDRTRAIVLVTPGNPTGVIVPPDLLEQFAALAREHDVMLVVDETYRSFRGTNEPAHALFSANGWADSVVSLHSFSKEFAIPGYRVGAVVGHRALLAEAMKLLDCVAICAPRIGQEAAHSGLTEANQWRLEQVEGVAKRHQRFREVMASGPGGFEVVSSGAYFGWVRHRFDATTNDVVRHLLIDHSVLTIPGFAFTGADERYIRMSFANLPLADFDELAARLASVSL